LIAILCFIDSASKAAAGLLRIFTHRSALFIQTCSTQKWVTDSATNCWATVINPPPIWPFDNSFPKGGWPNESSILVGHSYGGAVITGAGIDPKVAGLVYVAAFAPEAGQSCVEEGKLFPATPGGAEIRPDASGFLSLTSKGISDDFVPDLSALEQQVAFATQGPTAAAALGAKETDAAWKTKPTWFIVASNDRMIAPEQERASALAMKANTTEVPSGHCPMLSHPNEVEAVSNAPPPLRPRRRRALVNRA
jgi:predicted alpha/beta hydrolase family esterase